jgi:hypothetical protein
MVEITEDDKHIYIKINKRVNLDRIYNKNYFFSLGIDIVEPEIKKGGKKDNFIEVLDNSEKAIDDTGSAITKRVNSVVENLNKKVEPFIDESTILTLQDKLEFVIEKSGPESGFKTLNSYLEALKTSKDLNPLTTFTSSGLDYLILENLTNDLCSCIDYIKNYGMQLLKKKKDDVYLINGRFLFLTEEIEVFNEKMETEEESLLKLISELCSINYVRGEDQFKNYIYGTFLYRKLKTL